ncbi:hypothetical protein E2C01_042753 [Portunus trituberculatus]|uniref:Uncharacterized protein n=1 Tax=Portunus trituberculatus TaxID=210409 RepID=A0A5B7FU88_PORTR|nr:hypothetical protein [Portunus trituberculatus]
MGVGGSSSGSITLSLHKLWVINEAVLVLVVLIKYRINHVHQLNVGEQLLLRLWVASFSFMVGRVMPMEERFDEFLAIQLVVVICIMHLEVMELQLLVRHASSVNGHLQMVLDVVTLTTQVRVVQYTLVVASSSMSSMWLHLWLLLYLLWLLERMKIISHSIMKSMMWYSCVLDYFAPKMWPPCCATWPRWGCCCCCWYWLVGTPGATLCCVDAREARNSHGNVSFNNMLTAGGCETVRQVAARDC